MYITFFLVLFYPFKGLISASLSLIIGADVSFTIVRSSIIFVLFFVSLNLLIYNITFLTKVDKILFFIGIFGFLIGIAKMDMNFLYNTTLLFGLPVAFAEFRKINDTHFFKFTFVFFSMSTIYMLIENILFQPKYYGLGFEPISREAILNYSQLLIGTTKVNIADYRGAAGFIRTSGYLGNVLALPVFLTMGSTYFYVLVREKPKIINFIFSIVSIYILFVSLSTTAILAFALSALFYELFINKSALSIVIISFIIIGILIYIFSTQVGSYLFQRLITNLNNPIYFDMYFDFSKLLLPQNIVYLLIGKWGGWLHTFQADMIAILMSYGVIAGYFLYKRMLGPINIARKSDNILLKIFSITILPAFICLYHEWMTLNINVMFLVTLFIVKSNEISLNEVHASRVNLIYK